MGVAKVNVGDAVTPDWRKIGCGSSFVEPNVTSTPTIRAVASGDNVQIYIDGVKVIDVTDSRCSSANLGTKVGWLGNYSGQTADDFVGGVDDTFTRANGAPGTADSGQPWTVQLGGFTGSIDLNSNAVRYVAGVGFGDEVWMYADYGSATQDQQATFNTGGQRAALALRVTDAFDNLVVIVAGSSCTLQRKYSTGPPDGFGIKPTTYEDIATNNVATPGRLKLWTGTEWVRERCDDDRNDTDYAASGWSWTSGQPTDLFVGLRGVSFRGPLSVCGIEWWTEEGGYYGSGASGSYTGSDFQYPTIDVGTVGETTYKVRITNNPGYDTDFLIWDRSPILGHPLKMWDGTTWQTVACMVPA